MAPHWASAETYECLRCDTTQKEPKRSKRSKDAIVRCRGCGQTVYLVTEKAPPAEPKTKVCKTCGTKLRASNNREQCSVCWGTR